MMIDPLPTPKEDVFEHDLSAAEKRQILHDWQYFLHNGFKKLFFTRALYRCLTGWKFPAHYTQDHFWHYYFNTEVTNLKQFLAELASPEPLGLTTPTADLKAAMYQAMTPLYVPLNQVLHDLEFKHQEMIAAWHDFAVNSGIQNVTLPPTYMVSENTRNLLAYAAQIALKRQRPLFGLQRVFPFHQQALLSSVPSETEEPALSRRSIFS